MAGIVNDLRPPRGLSKLTEHISGPWVGSSFLSFRALLSSGSKIFWGLQVCTLGIWFQAYESVYGVLMCVSVQVSEQFSILPM